MQTIVRRLLSEASSFYQLGGLMTIEEAFGAVLRELRTLRGVTQESLAFNADLDRTFISLLERGQRQPSLATVFRLGNALQLPPAEIVDLVEKKLTAPPSGNLNVSSIST